MVNPPPIHDLRLAEITAALSLATDLGTGHPFERSLRACLLAIHFGSTLGLTTAQLHDLYYLILLRRVGCTATAHRANLPGDEIALGMEFDRLELWNTTEMLLWLWRTVVGDTTPLRRVQRLARTLIHAVHHTHIVAAAHCEVAQSVARRLGLSNRVVRDLGHIFERWDGRGFPGTVSGDALPPPVRIMHLAADAELFYRVGGLDAVIDIVRHRAAGIYDPIYAERFARMAPELFRLIEPSSVWNTVLASEPGVHARLSEAQIEAALQAIGDVTDLRSPTTLGHARAVASLVESAGRIYGLSAADALALRQAGLVHEVGMTGIANHICEKPGTLTAGEWERVRLHPYYTERILARPGSLGRIGALAALHHERLDGSGYYRGLHGSQLTPAACLLAATDVYQSLIEPRPYRVAFSPAHAADIVSRLAQSGQLDRDAICAVLDAAGHRARRTRIRHAAGLSPRELEVLRLLARGHSNRQMAERLVISERTIDHHIRHIYAKIGVSTRAAAALFAMEHWLLDPVEA